MPSGLDVFGTLTVQNNAETETYLTVDSSTGLSTIGAIGLAQDTAGLLSWLADVAVGNVLLSGGIGVAPSYGKVNLTSHITGNLPVTNLNSGTAAGATTFWRGDGQWASVASSGGVAGPGSSTDNALVRWDGTTGTVVQNSNATLSDAGSLALTAASQNLTVGTINGQVRLDSLEDIANGGSAALVLSEATGSLGAIFLYAGNTNPTVNGVAYTAAANTLHFMTRVGGVNTDFMAVTRGSNAVSMPGSLAITGNLSCADLTVSSVSSINATAGSDTATNFDFDMSAVVTQAATYRFGRATASPSHRMLFHAGTGTVVHQIGIAGFPVIWNANNDDIDFQIKGDNNANLLFVDASTDLVGIGVSTPRRRLDVLDTANPQLRLTYTDNSAYTDFRTDSSGILSITPTGEQMTLDAVTLISGSLTVNGGLIAPVSGIINGTGILAISGVGQFGSGTPTTYSRFGTSTTGHSLSGANDVVMDELETNGMLWADANITLASKLFYPNFELIDINASGFTGHALAVKNSAGTDAPATLYVIPQIVTATGALPTPTRAKFELFHTNYNADPTNYEALTIRTRNDSTYSHIFNIASNKGGTGIWRNLYITKDINGGINTVLMAVDMTNDRVGILTNTPGKTLQVNGAMQATDYYSGDGTQGMTGVVVFTSSDSAELNTITIKDGLITSWTQA